MQLLLSHWTLLQEVCETLHLMELFVKLQFVSELNCLSALMLIDIFANCSRVDTW